MTTPKSPQPSDSSLPIISLILGIASLTGPGLILGIPAIVTASIALKKNYTGRSFSITGLVTGIISTVLSILFLTLVTSIVIWAINHPESFSDQYYYPQNLEQHLEEVPRGSHT